MGFFDKLFKPKPQPEEESEDDAKKRSDELMERLKMRRGQETGKWLLMMENASKEPPPAGPPPTIEGIDERQILEEQPYTPPIEAQFMSLSPDDNPDASVTPFGQGSNTQPSEPEAQVQNIPESKPVQTVAPEQTSEQTFLQTTDIQQNRVMDQVNMLATWSACNALLKALDSDLAWLTGKQGSTELQGDQAQYLTDLSEDLRTLGGLVDGLLANYHPAQESQQNQS